MDGVNAENMLGTMLEDSRTSVNELPETMIKGALKVPFFRLGGGGCARCEWLIGNI